MSSIPTDMKADPTAFDISVVEHWDRKNKKEENPQKPITN